MRSTIRIPKRFSLMDLLWFVGLFSISSYALLEFVSISVSAFSKVKMPLLYLGAACLFLQVNVLVKNVAKKKYFFVLLALLALCACLGVSMLVPRSIYLETSPKRSTLRLIIFAVEAFALMLLISEKGRGQQTLKFLYRYVLFAVLANDALLMLRVVRFFSGGFETYLLGSKFSVMYMHFALAALWLMHNQSILQDQKRAKWLAAAALVVSAVVSIRVDCKTGVLGCAILIALIVLMDSRQKSRLHLFTSPAVLGLSLFISAVFPFFLQGFLELPVVTYLVQTVLKRDLTLTGRTEIYEQFVENMSRYWLWGYGFGTGNEVAMKLFGYANVQNAMLQWVLQVGVVCTALFGVLMMTVFVPLSRLQPDKQRQLMPLVALIYVYIILGVIETTYNMAFIMWFALLFMLVNEKKRPPAPVEASAGGRA